MKFQSAFTLGLGLAIGIFAACFLVFFVLPVAFGITILTLGGIMAASIPDARPEPEPILRPQSINAPLLMPEEEMEPAIPAPVTPIEPPPPGLEIGLRLREANKRMGFEGKQVSRIVGKDGRETIQMEWGSQRATLKDEIITRLSGVPVAPPPAVIPEGWISPDERARRSRAAERTATPTEYYVDEYGNRRPVPVQ